MVGVATWVICAPETPVGSPCLAALPGTAPPGTAPPGTTLPGTTLPETTPGPARPRCAGPGAAEGVSAGRGIPELGTTADERSCRADTIVTRRFGVDGHGVRAALPRPFTLS